MDNTIVTYIITNGCDGVYFFSLFCTIIWGYCTKYEYFFIMFQ